MRRRRLPRRPFRRGPLGGLPPKRRPIPPKLKEAHRLFDAGEYEQAAGLYAELAEKAEERGIPQAPNLYLRCGTAWIKVGDLEKTEEMYKKGLGILADRQKWFQLKKSGRITIERLKAEGQKDLAETIETWLEEQVPEKIKESDAWQKKIVDSKLPRAKLPSNCDNCGGPVNPKEVEWFDANNPVCSFCGTVLNTDD